MDVLCSNVKLDRKFERVKRPYRQEVVLGACAVLFAL